MQRLKFIAFCVVLTDAGPKFRGAPLQLPMICRDPETSENVDGTDPRCTTDLMEAEAMCAKLRKHFPECTYEVCTIVQQ